MSVRDELARHQADEALQKLMRKARADAWDDCAREAFDLGLIDLAQKHDLVARNPNGGCWA